MRIALFGGRFDPVHNGHIAVAEEVLKTKSVDEVWFVPDNIHQWNPIAASVEDRLAMLKLAVMGRGKRGSFKISDIAIRLGGKTNTIDVIDALKRDSYEFIFICGSDQIPNFQKWIGWKRLEKEISFLIIPRKGYLAACLPSNCKVILDKSYKSTEDASTTVRKKIKLGQSIKGLVPKEVEEYIIKRGLYRSVIPSDPQGVEESILRNRSVEKDPSTH